MGEHVRPIRAWAEYDTWSIYMADLEASTWDAILIPKGLAHWQRWLDGHGVTHIAQLAEARLGIPLRFLRVLFENGNWLEVESPGSIPESLLLPKTRWLWNIYDSDPEIDAEYLASGEFDEDKDSEAVERAMVAAAAYFTQAEGLDT